MFSKSNNFHNKFLQPFTVLFFLKLFWLLFFVKDRCPFLTAHLSGSPIIQNGKLMGAVTHVLVGDPTRGYGIFLENMLVGMPLLAQ